MEAFQPFYDRVVMEFVLEEKTDAGLFIPKTAQEKEASKAKVLELGPGKYDVERQSYVPMQVQKGDIVYVNPFLGMKVKVSRNQQLLVQREDEILGRVVPPEGGSGG